MTKGKAQQNHDDEFDDEFDDGLNRESIEADIAAGAKAYKQLVKSADKTWRKWWSPIIRGFRGLYRLAVAKSGRNDTQSWDYKQAMNELLEEPRYAIYGRIGGEKSAQQLRSTFYRVMFHLEDIDDWYAGQSPDDQARWNHPDAIVRNCPKAFVTGGKGHNRPKKKRAQRENVQALRNEVDRLKRALTKVIQRLLAYEPNAKDLLDEITPDDPDDSGDI